MVGTIGSHPVLIYIRVDTKRRWTFSIFSFKKIVLDYIIYDLYVYIYKKNRNITYTGAIFLEKSVLSTLQFYVFCLICTMMLETDF